jgi:hypothetical protein
MRGETMASRGGDETMAENMDVSRRDLLCFAPQQTEGCGSYWQFALPAHPRINAHADSTSAVACKDVNRAGVSRRQHIHER